MFLKQTWLAVSTDDRAKVSDRYFYHGREAGFHAAADNTALQIARLNPISPELVPHALPAR